MEFVGTRLGDPPRGMVRAWSPAERGLTEGTISADGGRAGGGWSRGLGGRDVRLHRDDERRGLGP